MIRLLIGRRRRRLEKRLEKRRRTYRLADPMMRATWLRYRNNEAMASYDEKREGSHADHH